MTEQLRVVTWRAVSTEDQVERESLSYQADLNQQHVARIGGIVIADLHVDGESRNIDFWEDATIALDAYCQLDALLRKQPRAFDILMCYDLSRLARTDTLLIALAKKCERAGIRIYECTSPPPRLDGPISTPDSRLMLLVRAHQYDQEVRKFAERSYFGRRARAAKGKLTGKPPYGYKRVYDELGIAYCAIDEDNAPIVRLFYDLYLNHGRSLHFICAEFKERGYVSPQSKKPWVPGNLSRLLKNAWSYAGYATWGSAPASQIPDDQKFRVKAEWQPLITEEMARRVEDERKARALGPRTVSSRRRFSGVARCGYCGGMIVAGHRKGHSGYADDRYGCRWRCSGSTVGERAMTAAIRKTILSLRDPAILESMIHKTPDHLSSLLCNKAEAEKALETVMKERKQLTLAFTRATITLSEYEELMGEQQEKMDTLRHSIVEIDDRIAHTPTAESRLQRLEEVRDRGLAMLENPDCRTAATWLRKHFVLSIRFRRVGTVEIL